MSNLETSPVPTNGKRSIALRLCLWAGVVGPILFVLVFTIDGFLQPHYSAMSQAVSYLAVASNGWIQDANFIVLGLLLILFALGFSRWMRPVIKQGPLLASTILLLLVGLGFINSGLFTAAAPGESPTAVHIVLHTIGFNVIFLSLSIACLIVGWQFRKTVAWRGYGWYSLITGLVTLVITFLGLLASFGLFSNGTQAPPPPYAGLFNRILVVEAFAWYVVIAGRMLTITYKEG